MKTVHVDLSNAPYPIHVFKDESDWGPLLQSLISASRVIILTNARVARLYLPVLKRALSKIKVRVETILLPDGERYKNLSTVARAYRGFIRLKADRSTMVLLLGGGVLGDTGGFAAATYMRGLPLIQIPTTLVAQVDSSIGGKLGVDLPEGKNLVGVFQQPRAVLSFIPFLRTLPQREIRGGLGEVLKYGIIEDPEIFRLVTQEREKIFSGNPEIFSEIVFRSSEIKAKVVSEDEKETSGRRLILNFGHTFGHAVERLTRYRKFHHGEAIAIGMVMAARLSHRLGYCSEETASGIEAGLRNVGLPASPPDYSREAWVRALEVDKKSREGMIRFIFIKRIGEVTVMPIQPKELVRLL